MKKIKVIKALNEEHGKEVIKYLESIGGENPIGLKGDSYYSIYYGILNGTITNFDEPYIQDDRIFEIIELPKKHPERGTKVLVWNNDGNKEIRSFLAYTDGAKYPVITVAEGEEYVFEKGDFFKTSFYMFYKLIPEPKITELSFKEIAEKFNIPIEQLRIKE